MGNLDLLKQLERSTKFSNFKLHLPDFHEETIYRTDNLGNKKKPMYIMDWPKSQFVYMKPMVRKAIKSKDLVELKTKTVNYYEINNIEYDQVKNDGNTLDTNRFEELRNYFAISSIIDVIDRSPNFVIEIKYAEGETDMGLLEDTLTVEMIQNIKYSEGILIVFTGSDFWTQIPSYLLPVLAEFCPSIIGSKYKKKEKGMIDKSISTCYYILSEDIERFDKILDTSYNNLSQFVENQQIFEKVKKIHDEFLMKEQ